MSIAPLPTVMCQLKTQAPVGKAVMKTVTETGKVNVNPMVDKKSNVAVDLNLGQNIDVTVGKQMDDKVEQKKLVEQEMLWIKNRQKMMNTKEVKLLQMREIAQQAMLVNSLSTEDLKKLDDRINNLAAQVSAIDSDSSRTKDGKVLE